LNNGFLNYLRGELNFFYLQIPNVWDFNLSLPSGSGIKLFSYGFSPIVCLAKALPFIYYFPRLKSRGNKEKNI
jgi:hypothetical protein